jgi:hypothetical protein
VLVDFDFVVVVAQSVKNGAMNEFPNLFPFRSPSRTKQPYDGRLCWIEQPSIVCRCPPCPSRQKKMARDIRRCGLH